MVLHLIGKFGLTKQSFIKCYFSKTETDPKGGNSYTISGTSQLQSVPYALHAKTAETLAEIITENDPVFSAWYKTTGILVTESQISDLSTYVPRALH